MVMKGIYRSHASPHRDVQVQREAGCRELPRESAGNALRFQRIDYRLRSYPTLTPSFMVGYGLRLTHPTILRRRASWYATRGANRPRRSGFSRDWMPQPLVPSLSRLKPLLRPQPRDAERLALRSHAGAWEREWAGAWERQREENVLRFLRINRRLRNYPALTPSFMVGYGLRLTHPTLLHTASAQEQ